jgi:hypothetical protein
MNKKNYGAMLSDIPLTDPKLEEGKYVASITYQIPRRILLGGRHKTSPKFETLYGLVCWLNKQDYNMEYTIYRTDKSDIIKEGNKKIGEIIK